MKNLVLILSLSILLLSGCGYEKSTSGYISYSEGTFKATVTTKEGEKNYLVSINCIAFEGNGFDTGFNFSSNKKKNKGTANEGIVVRGDRVNIGKDKSPLVMDGISLRIKDNGTVYESNIGVNAAQRKKEIWQKNENGVSGEVDLYLEGDNLMSTYLAVYEVICQ
jgi:hypothetical protein